MRYRKFKIRVIVSLLISIVFMQPLYGTVNGLSTEQLKLFRSGIYYYDAFPSACASGSSSLVGSEDAQRIYNYLLGKGLKPFQVAGIMGNISKESGYNPRRVQNTPTPSGDSDVMKIDDKTGYGISQWTSINRQQDLRDAAQKAGVQDSDMKVQLDFLWTELTGSYKTSSYDPLVVSTNLRDATVIYLINFEGPAAKLEIAEQNDRVKRAQSALTKFGSTTISDASISDTSSVSEVSNCGGDLSNNSNLVGEYSLPVDQKWFDENRIWFSKDHKKYPAADIPVPNGTKVYAVAAGKITRAPIETNNTSYGRGVQILSNDGIRYTYAHGSDGGSVPGAKVNDTVKAGQLIMHSSNTGNVQGANGGYHLHFEINIPGGSCNYYSTSVPGWTCVCPQELLLALGDKKSPPAITSLKPSGCTD